MKISMKEVLKAIVVIILPFACLFVLHLFAPNSIGMSNVTSLLKQAIAPAILGWGVLFNMKVGNWDFAVGSEVLLASIIGGNLAIKLNLGIFGLFICCCVVGLVCGAIVGILYYLLKIPTIIVSIGMLLIYESVGSIVFDGGGVMIPTEWVIFNNFPYNLILILILGAFAYYLINRSKFGYNVRAVGSAANIALSNGINASKVKMLALTLVGLFAGFYAVTNLGMNGVQRTVGSMGTMATCFDAMMCVFVGMALSKGVNIVFSIYLGSFLMQIIKLGFMVFGLPNEFNSIVIAIIVLVCMTFNNNSEAINKLFTKNNKKAALA